jgi:hypothetical protein
MTLPIGVTLRTSAVAVVLPLAPGLATRSAAERYRADSPARAE